MDNYHAVVEQMEAFGVQWRRGGRDLPLQVDTPKRKTCGQGGKWWYWLRTFRPDAGGCYIVGRFGSYKTGDSQKVEVDWAPLSQAEKARLRAERAAAEARQREERARESALAAMSAAELWRTASPTGTSAYLRRKLVDGEACRYLPDGSLVIPLLRYDLPRDQALRAVQRIYPGPRTHWRTGEPLPDKTFTKGFDKPGCCLRLGHVVVGEPLLICEGYATGLSIRMALQRKLPVFVALDAGNLQPVAELLRTLHPHSPILICADDDWRTTDHAGRPYNPGRDKAWRTCKALPHTHLVYPIFGPGRGDKDTDFNDLHAREGLGAVRRQLLGPLRWFGHVMEETLTHAAG